MGTALKLEDITVEQKPLYVPHLEEIAKALSTELPKYFQTVSIDVVKCPDLTEEPFKLAAKGLSGCASLLDIGGPPYLLPLPLLEKVYDMKNIPKLTGNDPAFIFGAGAAPWPYIGVNAELIANVVINNGNVTNLSRACKVKNEDDPKPVVEILPDTETRFCVLGNFFCCKGEPGNVVQVSCQVRIGELNFISSIQKSLQDHFAGKCIGIGGVVLIKNGKAKHHVMRDFSKTPINTDEKVNRWLKFYNMSAPLLSLGTFVTEDPGLDLRMTHFHSFGKTEGGHYHYDTTPEYIEYVAYFSPGSTVYRVDRPINTHLIGRD